MVSTIVLGLIVFGFPSIIFLFIGIDLLLHIKGIKDSFSKNVRKNYSTIEGKRVAKRYAIISFFIFGTLSSILIDGIING